jgi:hypothetical protein
MSPAPIDSIAKSKSDPNVTIILIKGPKASKCWLDELARDVGVSKATVVDLALKDFAAARDFRPMPRRLVR